MKDSDDIVNDFEKSDTKKKWAETEEQIKRLEYEDLKKGEAITKEDALDFLLKMHPEKIEYPPSVIKESPTPLPTPYGY